MALIARGMYKLLLRVHVEQDISQEGWRFLLSNTLPALGRQLGTPSFDGEILSISAMNPMDMSAFSEQLMSFGFKWAEGRTDSDFSWFAFELPNLDWLEAVKARPLRSGLSEVELWQKRGSELGYFADHEGKVWWRGSDYDW